MMFYKTNSADALKAKADFEAQCKLLYAECDRFKEYMGAAHRYTNSGADRIEFAGLTFDPPKPADIWTKPDEYGRQRLRGSIPKSIPAERRKALTEQLIAAKKDWSAHVPMMVVVRDPVWESLGTEWGSVLISGIASFEHDETIYVKTQAKVGDFMVEILASEYDAAKAALEASKQKVTA